MSLRCSGGWQGLKASQEMCLEGHRRSALVPVSGARHVSSTKHEQQVQGYIPIGRKILTAKLKYIAKDGETSIYAHGIRSIVSTSFEYRNIDIIWTIVL